MPLRIAESPEGLHPGDHLCWPYRGRSEFADIASRYVTEGLDRGERIIIVTEESPEDVRQDLAGITDIAERIAGGQVIVADYDAFLDLAHSDPGVERAALQQMQDEALAAGYPALRMLSDATDRSMHDAWLTWHAAMEHVVDRFCLRNPLTAMCAYDVTRLDADHVLDMAVLHASGREGWAPFQLRAAAHADMQLAGSVDAFSADQLGEALDRIRTADPKGMVVIDASDVDFLDHRALSALNDHATRTHSTIVLWSPPAIAERISSALGLGSVRIVTRPGLGQPATAR